MGSGNESRRVGVPNHVPHGAPTRLSPNRPSQLTHWGPTGTGLSVNQQIISPTVSVRLAAVQLAVPLSARPWANPLPLPPPFHS